MADKYQIEDYFSKFILEDASGDILTEDGNRLLMENAATATTDDYLLEDGTYLLIDFPYTVSLAETQGAQSDSIAASETYKASIAESQAAQADAIAASETFKALLSENQSSQSDSVSIAETYQAALVEAQSQQSEAITGNVGTSSISVLLSESQVQQLDSISGTSALQTGEMGTSTSWLYWKRRRLQVRETQRRQVDSASIEQQGIIPPVPVFSELQISELQAFQTDSSGGFQEILFGGREWQAKQADKAELRQGNILSFVAGQKKQQSRMVVKVEDSDDEEVLVSFLKVIA